LDRRVANKPFAQWDERSISWRRGEECRVPINACCLVGWDVARTGIYFLNLDFPPNGRTKFFDFANRQSTPILALDKPVSLFGGLALSPDGNTFSSALSSPTYHLTRQ
jgi:hypothetical protein